MVLSNICTYVYEPALACNQQGDAGQGSANTMARSDWPLQSSPPGTAALGRGGVLLPD